MARVSITSIYEKIVLLSPYIEVLFRKLYWRNVKWLHRLKANKTRTSKQIEDKTVNFDLILSYLRKMGVSQGALVIVHSSYEALSRTGLDAEDIVNKLQQLIAPTGTLAMPVIRKYKEMPTIDKILTTSMENTICTYNVQKSRIVSGLLPYFLMNKKESITSRFPLNPMTACGPLAVSMMEHNLEGEAPSPHGTGSAWKFCMDHDAIIVGLGVDLAHNLTITHVAEEAYPGWVFKNWFRKRIFDIKDNSFETRIIVHERRPELGMLYFAERNYRNDMIKENILQINDNEGIEVSVVYAKSLLKFLQKNNKNGYPYFKI